MIIKIPIGRTCINIEALQIQIDALRSLGYNDNDNIPIESYINLYIGKDKNKFGETFKNMQKTFSFLAPDYRIRNENCLKANINIVNE